jgi:hypothetical protein
LNSGSLSIAGHAAASGALMTSVTTFTRISRAT